MHNLLKPVRRKVARCSPRDTFKLIGSVNELNMKGRRIISLDVIYLLTTMEKMEYLYDHIKNSRLPISLPIEGLKQLLFFRTHTVQLKFTNHFFHQKTP